MQLLIRSLYLDIQFVSFPLPKWEIIIFLIKKYILLLKNIIFGFKPGQSYIKIFGHNYYYYDKFGIAFLQSVMIEGQCLTSYIKPNSIIVDVGAHVGEFNLFSKLILKALQVISIEPIKQSYLLLRKNAAGKTYNFAVSTEKNVIMYTHDTTIMSSSLKNGRAERTEKCQGIYLDNLEEVNKLKKIDLLKIDVEGAEYNVLITSQKTLKKTRYLFIEASINRPSYGDIHDILHLVKKSCPLAKLIYIGKPFIVFGKPFCVDLLIKCNT